MLGEALKGEQIFGGKIANQSFFPIIGMRSYRQLTIIEVLDLFAWVIFSPVALPVCGFNFATDLADSLFVGIRHD